MSTTKAALTCAGTLACALAIGFVMQKTRQLPGQGVIDVALPDPANAAPAEAPSTPQPAAPASTGAAVLPAGADAIIAPFEDPAPDAVPDAIPGHQDPAGPAGAVLPHAPKGAPGEDASSLPAPVLGQGTPPDSGPQLNFPAADPKVAAS